MITDKQIKLRLQHVLTRPEMYAGSAEALEAQVLTLLWSLDLFTAEKNEYTAWHNFWRKKYPKHNKNTPLWEQMYMGISDMATLLKDFITTLHKCYKWNCWENNCEHMDGK
jgi:hypothetical protein